MKKSNGMLILSHESSEDELLSLFLNDDDDLSLVSSPEGSYLIRLLRLRRKSKFEEKRLRLSSIGPWDRVGSDH